MDGSVRVAKGLCYTRTAVQPAASLLGTWSAIEEFPIGASFEQLRLYYTSALMENRKVALPMDLSSLIAELYEDAVRIDFLDVQDYVKK